MTGATQALIPGTETVQVLSDGSTFNSIISLSNNNSVTSYTSYVNQGQAILVSGSQITIVTKDTPIIPGLSYWSETTGINTYSPAQLTFPSSIVTGTHETSDSADTLNITGTTHYIDPYPFDSPIPATNNTSQQHVDILVGLVEPITVPAGIFQALKLTMTITSTDNSGTSTTTVDEWFASGVGLVKMIAYTYDRDPPNQTIMQTRELVSYKVSVSTMQQLSVSISGTGTVTSNPDGINCANGSQNGCSAPYSKDSTVVLTATPSWYSTVGWGNCTVDANDVKKCSALMDADKTITAAFSVIQKPVLIMGDQGYDTLLAASQAVGNNGTIMARDTYESAQSEPLVFSNGFNVILNGGMNSNWSATGSFTTMKGTLKIKSGKILVKNVKIRL
ncbi:MAG: hypothetical protein M0T70_09180 [Geobacteraceae bacterium]|nr:hypothetical protein [Geobacteraceae bacterium]